MNKTFNFLGFSLSISNEPAPPPAPIIEFYCPPHEFGAIPPPVPSFKKIPGWFKKLQDRLEGVPDHHGAPAMTAKMCKPLLDGFSLGYIIPLWSDVYVRTDEEGTMFAVDTSEEQLRRFGRVIEFHSQKQVGGPGSPFPEFGAPKFINKWVVKTAPGYSCLFIAPVNSEETRFTCLSAVVDTDMYPKEVNFPAKWHATSYEGMIKAGTPLVQVIPFKRADVPRDIIVRAASVLEMEHVARIAYAQGTRLNVYSDELREPRKERVE